jgi:uncharacterized membrane protein
MSLGPIDFLALKFPDNEFRGEILPALADLVEAETIRIIDLLFVQKYADGGVHVVELADLGEDDYRAFEEVVSDVSGMLSHEDAQQIAMTLEPDSSAALLLFENLWANRFVDAVANAKGEVVMSERIPRAMIEEMLSSDLSA